MPYLFIYCGFTSFAIEQCHSSTETKKMTTVILSSCLLSIFLLILNKGFLVAAADLRICSKSQRHQVMRKMVHCAPRDTVVPVFTPPNLSSIQPRHVIVKKCQGSCWALAHQCISSGIRNLSVPITGQQNWGKNHLFIQKLPRM